MPSDRLKFEVAVVGGGHAGIEAALAAARMGARTALVTLSEGAIGRMSCNPAIGGIAKGHLVREIDALGGEMGWVADLTGIHFKMLNQSKGPAVQSPRCQSDKYRYSATMVKHMRASPVEIVEGEVEGLLLEGSSLTGLRLSGNRLLEASRVIVTSGTFMNGLIHRGKDRIPAGRIDEPPSTGLPKDLKEMGFETLRLKTGTPPRVHSGSLNYDQMEVQIPDEVPQPFSFRTRKIDNQQVSCHIAWTGEATRKLILDHQEEIPLFNGQIEGLGPRYCPSIEDKICRFPDRERHQIFIEPEGLDTDEVYLNGISTSMSEDLQDELLRSIPGLEKAKVFRYGYAIEYDFCPPHQIQPTMETRTCSGLYFAGQINGTTGYEEAAAQGLIAGINAVLSLKSEEPFVPGRHESYIGVLLDDLVTKEILEPYRMFTSRAEHRLLLRHDNADQRLMERGYRFGLVQQKDYERMCRKWETVSKLEKQLEKVRYGEDSVALWLRRPENHIQTLLDEEEPLEALKDMDGETARSLEIQIKYAGYLDREAKRVERLSDLENAKLPEHIDYLQILEMRREGREKLHRFRPKSIGQARRIAGVNPADLHILEVYMKRRRWPLLKKPTAT